MGKRPWLSKTFWVNGFVIIGILGQMWGKNFIIPPEYQVIILAALNKLLRTITKEKINWSLK